MFRIGEFSKLAKTTVKTLRFYDEIGLFKPALKGDNGYRYYSIKDLATLTFIVELRSYGVPVDEVKKIVRGDDVLGVLTERKRELESEIEKNNIDLSLINKLLAKAEKGDIMQKYQAKEITIPEYTVYYRHGVIDSMENLFDFVLGAGEETRTNNPDLECEDYCFITYASHEYQDKNVELEYTEAVKTMGKESENIKFKKIPAIKAIAVEHYGAYTKLGEAYAFAVNYVKEHGLEMSGKIRECYVHGIWDCDSEDDYLTVIQVPVK